MIRQKKMRAIALDYEHSRRWPEWPDLLLLIGGVSLAAYISIHYVTVTMEIDLLEAKRAAFEQRPDRASDSRLASLDAQQLRTEVNQANEVLGQLSLPWETLFRDIDSSQKDQVALLAIEPDSKKRVIKFTGEAKNFDALIDFVSFLQSKESLASVYLQSHQIERQMPEHPVRFVLTATWVIKP